MAPRRLSEWRRRIEPILSRVRRGGRKAWTGAARTHLELRDLDPERLARVQGAIESGIERFAGVRWARVHPHLGHLIVEHAPDVARDTLVLALAILEQELGIDDLPFPVHRPDRHPGDHEPLTRTLVEMGVDAWALVMGLAARRLGRKSTAYAIDISAALYVLEGVPGLRRVIERVFGIPTAELLLRVGSGLVRPLVQSDIGSISAILHRALLLRELSARRRLWAEWEQETCSNPEQFPRGPVRKGREQPRPPGPVERYSEHASSAIFGAFSLGLAASASLEAAAGPVIGGVPRPAFLGRDAFAAHLGLRLARAGVLVLDSHALRRLDRIDCVVVQEELAGAGPEIGDAASAAEVELVVDGEDPIALVRELQEQGRTVAYLASGPGSALGVADISIGVRQHDGAAPWGAHVFCRGREGAAMIVSALAAARSASRQSVALAGAEALVGLGLASRGLRNKTTRSIMTAAGTASILAMANGIRLARAAPGPRPPRLAQPAWHAMESREVTARLESDPAGLDGARAAARRVPRARPPSTAAMAARFFVDELANPITPVLAVGAGLSALAGGAADAALIGGVLVGNGMLGAGQRLRTEQAIAELSRRARRRVRVRRGSALAEVRGRDLVPGDVIELDAGGLVPADCRILEASGLEVDESAMTGESLPARKGTDPVAPETPVAERSCMLYEGTAIAAGSVVAVVVAVGEETEARRGLAEVAESTRPGVERRLEALTRMTLPVAGVAGGAVAAAGAVRRQPIEDLIASGVGLAVAAVPEGLPLLATVGQLAAADRLAARGALVRNPRAVEALGRIDVLCADKTGTLTEGRIRLALVSDGIEERSPEELGEPHRRILAVGVRASANGDDGPIAHLTDAALIDGARRAGVARDEGLEGWTAEEELPFDPMRGYHAGVGRHARGRALYVKGAPEQVVPRCRRWRRDRVVIPIDDEGRQLLLEKAQRLAERGYRVLAIASRPLDGEAELEDTAVTGLTFGGFVGLADVVRQTARAAVKELAAAGVKVLMLTGDHPGTASVIASELGIGGRVVTGPEMDVLDDEELAHLLEQGDVGALARVTPVQKVRIVRALQEIGHAVGMTGDGANDAPAIRLADVGVALGARSTEAARAAADLVIRDERIETLVSATLEGRALWSSVRDAVSLLVGGNLGEILFTFGAGLAGGRSPLNARQLLLVNLVTDTLPAMAIATRPPRKHRPEDLLREGPESSLGRPLERDILWRAGITSAAAGGAWILARFCGSPERAGTVALLALTGSQLGQTLLESGRSSAVVVAGLGSAAVLLGAVQIPVLSRFFGCRPLGPLGLAQASVATLTATAAAAVLPRLLGRS